MHRLTAVLATACLLAAGAADAARAYSIEDVLSVPYPTDLVAAAEAPRIAWVMNERGVRNLWTAAAPGFEPVCLTGYREDDGQPLESLLLSRDGSLLVFVRGGGPNAAGENPNPTSDPRGAEQAIWVVRTGGGEAWKVAVGGAPVLAPPADKVVFARGDRILVAPLAPPAGDGEVPEPATLLTARGRLRDVTFSPDGRRLAFVSDRDDHSFIGVYDFEAETITWMAPDVDRDNFPVFSPDGRRLAFVRIPGRKNDELFDWAATWRLCLWVGDPATGEAEPVWSSPGADNGFPQIYVPEPLRWAGADRLVFVSEHEGWMHFYSVPATGGEAVDLTPGEGEVESGAVSGDGRFFVYAANHGDSHRRHLWRVPTAGGEAELLTPGDGIETHPVVLAGGGGVAFRGADVRRPQAVKVLPLAGGGMRTVAPRRLPDAYPAEELIVPKVVTLTAADGLEVPGILFLPPEARPGDGRPAVVFLHGGPVRQMLQGVHYRPYYARAYAFNQYLASRGYVVLALNFRSGIGLGRGFRRAPEQGPGGASEYRDLVAAGLYLRRRPEVDPERIGLWGGSYGGYLTAMGLARDSDLFAAGVDLHGVDDYAYRARAFFVPGGGRGIAGEEEVALARQSSPVAYLSTWSSPVLVIHGDDDRNVQFIHSTDLVQRLRERRVHVETLVFPDEVHNFLRHDSWLRAYRAAEGFFQRFLQGAP